MYRTSDMVQQTSARWRGTWDSPFYCSHSNVAPPPSLSLSFSPSSSVCLRLSPSQVDKTWAERMWNIYSALAQSTLAAHTLYLPWREILSVLPLPPSPPESLSPHWPKLNTNYMSHCSAFTATLKPAAPVPNISLQPQILFQHGWKKKTWVSWAATCAFDSLLISFFVF